MQLVAVGAQNYYLTTNPQYTFFKAVYRRHTNFSMEFMPVSLDGPNELNINESIKLRAKIPRNADLCGKIFFRFRLPDIYSNYDCHTCTPYRFEWIRDIGTQLIEEASVYIGGQLIDRQYGEWMRIWSELFLSDARKKIYNEMIANTPELYHPAQYMGNNNIYPTSSLHCDQHCDPEYPRSFRKTHPHYWTNSYGRPPSIRGRIVFVPLLFWFCDNPGLALPLVALQYHEVQIELILRPIKDLYTILETRRDPRCHECRGGDSDDDGSNNSREPEDCDHSQCSTKHSNNTLPNSVVNSSCGPSTCGVGASSYCTSSGTGSDTSCSYSCARYQCYRHFGRRIRPYRCDQMIDRFLSPYAEDAACQLDCLGDCSSFKGWGFFPSLDVNYIYLGEEERSRFAANTHEYLITQLQRSLHLGIVGQKLLDLQFQHPVKYIAWIARRDDCSYRNQWENYTNWLWCDISPFSASYPYLIQEWLPSRAKHVNRPTKETAKYFISHILYEAKVMFNGVDRFTEEPRGHFEYVQPFAFDAKSNSKGINIYSFALKLDTYQPSGSCNMSRIKDIQLEVKTIIPPSNYSQNETLQYKYKYDFHIFGTSYNIFKVQSGMGALVFSN